MLNSLPVSKETGIFVHPYSDHQTQKRARQIKADIPGSFLTQEVADLEKTSGPILIAGGDGSIRRVMDVLRKNDQLERQIATLGGGTNNVLHRALIKAGAALSLESFLDPDTPKERYSLRPGVFGDDQVFTVAAGVGKFEKDAGSGLERFRAYVPRRWRPDFASIASLFSTIAAMVKDPNFRPIDLVSTSPDFGSVTLFPRQELHSTLLTHAWIEERGIEGARKLLLTLLYWRTGNEPPQSILRTEQANEFTLLNHDSTLWVDGDTFFRRNHGNVLVSRAAQALAVTAIIPTS